MSPVSEANGSGNTCTTDHTEGVDEETDDGNDLDKGNPELDLTVVTDGHKVGACEDEVKDQDPRPGWDCQGPVFDDLPDGEKLDGKGDGPGEPIAPIGGKPDGLGQVLGVEGTEGTCDGCVCGHFT